MCLIYSENNTLKLRKRKSKRIKIYKVYKVIPKLQNLYQYNRNVTISKNGIVKSNRKSIKIHDSEIEYPLVKIRKGIHVFLSLSEAKNETSYNDMIFQGYANISDLVGVNQYNDHAVFLKIKFEGKELKKLRSYQR